MISSHHFNQHGTWNRLCYSEVEPEMETPWTNLAGPAQEHGLLNHPSVLETFSRSCFLGSLHLLLPERGRYSPSNVYVRPELLCTECFRQWNKKNQALASFLSLQFIQGSTLGNNSTNPGAVSDRFLLYGHLLLTTVYSEIPPSADTALASSIIGQNFNASHP